MRFSIVLILLFIAADCSCTEDRFIVRWTFKANDRILSHPAVEDRTVYFGSNDGSFHAVEAGSGQELWRFGTRASIRGRPLVADGIVYVVSGNDVYALNAMTGEQIWSDLNEDSSGADQIDSWDYHTGAPVLDGSTLYVGLGDGYVHGIDAASGKPTLRFATADTVPVRSGLLIEAATLYFGDWNGRVYAYDLGKGVLKWTTRTYDERPYETFGALTAEFAIHDDLLLFGARNTELMALDKHDGSVVWSYREETGGWISGDPLVEDGMLYIAGSDNHELFAFDAATGEKIWIYEFAYNNFSRPLIHEDVLFLTIGDAYSVWGEGNGRGYLYALNKHDGTLLNLRGINGNSYSSPAISNGLLFIGSEDSTLYAFDITEFLHEKFDPAATGYDAIEVTDQEPAPLVVTSTISYRVKYPAAVYVDITTLAGSTVRRLVSGDMPAGDHEVQWDGTDDDGVTAADGYYFVKVGSQDFYRTSFLQKASIE